VGGVGDASPLSKKVGGRVPAPLQPCCIPSSAAKSLQQKCYSKYVQMENDRNKSRLFSCKHISSTNSNVQVARHERVKLKSHYLAMQENITPQYSAARRWGLPHLPSWSLVRSTQIWSKISQYPPPTPITFCHLKRENGYIYISPCQNAPKSTDYSIKFWEFFCGDRLSPS